MFIYINIYVYIHICTYVYMYICIYVYAYIVCSWTGDRFRFWDSRFSVRPETPNLTAWTVSYVSPQTSRPKHTELYKGR